MKYLILFFCLGIQIIALAQSSTVKEVVKGRDGKPLASVSVYIGNYNNGTAIMPRANLLLAISLLEITI